MEELQKLYDVLVREGKYSKSFEEFQTKWSNDAAYKNKVYTVVTRDGLYSKDKDSFFEKYSTPELIVKKKVSSESAESQVPQAGTTGFPSEDGSSDTQQPTNKFGVTSQDLKDIGKEQPTDMSGKPLLPEVDAKLIKSISERPKPLEKIERQKSYNENLGTSLMSGLNDVNKMISSIPETVYNAFSWPQQALAYATGLDISTNADKFKKNLGITNPVLDYYKEEGKKLEAETAKFNKENYKSSSIYKNLEDGNYQDAFELLGTGIARSAPTSIAIMAGGATMSTAELATASTAAFYNQNLEELQEENPNASDIENSIKALGMSAAESVFSAIGEGQIGAIYRDIIRKEGAEVGKQVFKDGLVQMYKGALEKYGVPVGLMGEGIEESATQITQNMISGKPAFQGAADAFILGGGSGVMFTSPISLKNANDRINNKVKEVQDKKQINLILDGSTDGLNKVFDVAKDSEINEKQLSIASLDKSRDLLVKDLDRGVKKGDITKDQAKQSLYVFDKTKQITGQLRGLDIDEKSKVTVANLLKERESLSDKIQGKDDALSVLEKQRISEINDEIKQTILKSKEDAVQEQTTDESVLRTEQPELELQGVGKGNAKPIEVTTEETITNAKPQEIKSGQKVFDILNRPATLFEFGGSKLEQPLEGDIYQDGQRVIFEDVNKNTYDLGNIDEVSNNDVEDLGIKPQEELITLTPEGKVNIGNNTWNIQSELPTKGIDYNEDGSVKAVSLKDDSGKTVMYEGQIAEDIAYQTLLKEFQTEEQIQAINEILDTDEELNKQLGEAEKITAETTGKTTKPSVAEIATTEGTNEVVVAEIDNIKSDIYASKERLKKAWDKYKTMGIAFDPKNNLARDRELVNSLIEYAYNNIRLGSYEASKLIKDLAEQGFEITKDGAKFIIEKATQKIATEESKSEIKDLKGQVVDVFRAGIQAVKIAETTAKEKARDIKAKAQELAKYLDNLKGKGKITSTQAAVMVKRFSKVNVLSEKSVNRFIDYATKVLNDANYNTKLNEARKTLSSLKKLSKNAEKNADLRALGSEFVKIDPSMVENIDEYNDIANKLKTALEGSKTRKSTTNFAETVNIEDTIAYTDKILAEQEIKLREEKIKELQELLDVDASTFSAEEIDTLFDIYGEEKSYSVIKDNEKIIRAAVNKAFNIYSTVIDEMLSTGVDPFTEEELEFTDAQKKIIREFMGIDLDTITDNKEALRIIDSLINFIQNKSTAGMLKPIADYQAIVGGNELRRQKIEGQGIRKFWSSSFGKTLAEQFTSLNLLFEKEFKGFNVASKVRKMMGITDLVNGKSIGQSESNRIVKKYVEQFYNKTANGEAFNSAYNDIERGIFAHVYRNVIGTDKRRKAVFDKRKQEVSDAIDFLKENGNKEEKQLAELYKKAYDKILDGSENIEDVRKKTDANNVDGVNYWVNQWANKFDALSDLALNFYNKILNRDLGYTPDRFKRLQGETKEIDLENDESVFISNTDGVLYNKKSGSLMDKQENRKTPKGMFIDLSFDSKNSNSMYDAMIDLNTAFSIRKVQSFLNSDNFNKIFKDDADLFKKRITSYVRLSRRKSPYTGSELSGLIQKLDKVATIGVTQALASPTQPFKQTIPVAASTLINAGSLGMGAAFNPSYNDWLDKLGYAISNRGIESRAEIESINRLLEKAASSKKEKAIAFVREANEKMLKWTLVNFDIWIARASFKAYYEQYLKKEGLYNDIPKKQSRFGITEIDYDNHEPNDDAADYAQEMIDRQQNISDYDLAGDLFTDKNSITKAFIKMLMAFSSFRMNQGSRLGADLTTLEYWNTSTKEDKVIALRSIAGYTAEQAVFRGLQITFGMMFYYAAKSLMGRGDDEEEDDKYKNNLIKASSTGAITDTFSPLPLLDPYVQNLSATSVDAIQDIVEIPEKDKIKLFEANKQEAVKALGVYGIVPERAGQIWDLGKLAYTRKFKDNYGKEKEISQEDADALKVLIGPYIASSVTGVLAPDISSLVRKSIKISEKKSGKTLRTVKKGDEFK